MPAKRPIQLEDLFRLKALGRVAISPDGRSVAYEVKRFDFKENKNFTRILLSDVESGATRPLTQGQHSDTRPCWSPDGKRLAFISDRGKCHCLWVLPMSGGEPRRVSDREGHVHEFAWSPDGRRLAFSYQPLDERQKLVRDGKEKEAEKLPQFKHITRLFHKLDGAGWWNGHYTHIWIIAAEGGSPARRLTSGDFDDSEPGFSPDGKQVSFVSNRYPERDLNLENSDIFAVPASGGRPRRITRGDGRFGSYSWSPDGSTLACLGNPGRTGQTWKYNDHIWLVPSAGGRPRELTREVDNNCRNLTLGDVTGAAFEGLPPIWSADSSRVYFPVSEGGAVRLYSRSVRRSDLRCEVGGGVNILYAQRTALDGPIALSMGSVTNPGDVFIYEPEKERRALRQVSRINEELLDRLALAQPEPFKVRSGRAMIHGWVLKPPGFNKNRRYPAILEIHGGPAGQYGFSFFHEMQWLAARGYVVAYGNPRGSVGYGLKHMNCILADWGNLDYKDCMRLADWLFARPYVDRKRVGVTGGSYGGYMTNWMVGHTDRFKAAVTQRSVVNMESMFGTSDYGFDMRHEFGGMPWKNVENLRRQSPITYVKNIRTPLLIEHEEQDHRCPIEQAEQLFSALKVLGQEVELVRFEGESHGLSRSGRPQNRAERLRRIGSWFDRYLAKK